MRCEEVPRVLFFSERNISCPEEMNEDEEAEARACSFLQKD